MTNIVFWDHEFSMDVVSREVPGLIGMDILDSRDHGRSKFKLDISDLIDYGQWLDLIYNY